MCDVTLGVVLDHADYTDPTRQRELHPKDQEYVLTEISGSSLKDLDPQVEIDELSVRGRM